MIDKSLLKENDKGRPVYVLRNGLKEIGVIRDWNEHCIFIYMNVYFENDEIVKGESCKAIGINFKNVEFKED